jgi:hypothetical protein
MRVRDEIVDALWRELIGPSPGLPFVQLSGEEALPPEDPPRLRYGAGILFPAKAKVPSQEDIDNASEPENGSTITDEENLSNSEQDIRGGGESDPLNSSKEETQIDNDLDINASNQYLPSALGLTALIDVPEKLIIEISVAQYKRVPSIGKEPHGEDSAQLSSRHWFRVPLDQSIEIRSDSLLAQNKVILSQELNTENEDSRLCLHIYSREGFYGNCDASEKTRYVTFTLVNRTESTGYPRDEDCFYQCSIRVRGSNDEPCFLAHPDQNLNSDTSLEEKALSLLYRHRKIYAVGHGCAPEWDRSLENQSRGKSVWSTPLPSYEVKPILPASLDNIQLNMLALAEEDSEDTINTCNELAEKYESWISEREQEAESDPDIQRLHSEAAKANMDSCRECLVRLKKGIDLIQSDDKASLAFALMNRAMLMQHEHFQISTESKLKRTWEKTSAGLKPSKPFQLPDYKVSQREWRPFQLAFILITLRSIVLEDADDIFERKLVDLIWFPTGGGKTEAYLGLAAFTIFYRRLVNPKNGGTTALMRYTLRLLTTQQYQRAASLICSMEKLRREDPLRLGEEVISIGLWVGGSVTPNKESRAIAALGRLNSGEKENPFIVLSCPWCGVQMGPIKVGNRTRVKGYRKLLSPNRVRLVCEDSDCEFSKGEGLPLLVIDEHIYRCPPTLIIGTVDKFAMMPWNPECRSLFGIGSGGNSPPDLIIQDELHLISGPLGSMVGHYETVIDALTERETPVGKVAAKIVASTATISRADDQVRRLYGGRESRLFPPQGLVAGDSFFAQEDSKKEGRLYCGVFATGLPSLTTAQVRVLGSLLQSSLALNVDDPSKLDPYWTLMVYFNSIRELGHAATLIKADIPEYMSVICRRLGLSKAWSEEAARNRRWINHDMELTSRIQNSEITEYMERLFARYPKDGGNPPVDVCLATNMIQVGLDVSRLSLMAIVGQPKMTSEYIQASSRVGRSAESPGLVVTLLSPTKPRDRSHFEHFRSYHQSLYRFVEPTSVTPFALPVSERALHALVISFVRFWGTDRQRQRPNPPPSAELEARIREVIMIRVKAVEPEESNRVAKILDDIFGEWRRLPSDVYGYFSNPGDEVPMMFPSGSHPNDTWDGRAYQTPSSMRNVDASCNAAAISDYPN